TEPAEAAMAKASQLVSDCVRAGYGKIHLDASMRLGDDPEGGPPVELAAERGAELCRAAEEAYREAGRLPPPRYIIGTEVPIPGGEVGNETGLQVTRVASARQTLELTQAAFRKKGIENAWERVFGLVVQPGVEFGDRTLFPYRPEQAAELSRWIESIPGIVFEAHSTDYQALGALSRMVADHFAILKVGPALTFAFREAVFALESIEMELCTGSLSGCRSHLQDVIDQEMLDHPGYWQRYYPGSPEEQRLMRRFSLSDRIRYYWSGPRVQAALARLLENLRGRDIPPGLVSQYFPGEDSLAGERLTPDELIERHIRRVLDGYWEACYSHVPQHPTK
ncbi:MAG TPA: class II D-tagatose-bisphosphate aldolase, non-catalytic subunit, partial [Candidatus Methylomirabilis sp.]|nr:class II D-tagatose-bisphosphate aldolase, non-catalytic subunit [Candidatus Methylomirabilis sp.]